MAVRDEDVGSSSEKCVDITGISSVDLLVTSTPTVTGGLNVAAVQAAGSPAVGWAVGILIGVILGAVLTMVVLIVIVVVKQRDNKKEW